MRSEPGGDDAYVAEEGNGLAAVSVVVLCPARRRMLIAFSSFMSASRFSSTAPQASHRLVAGRRVSQVADPPGYTGVRLALQVDAVTTSGPDDLNPARIRSRSTGQQRARAEEPDRPAGPPSGWHKQHIIVR